jgi:metallo-beta-lactamase class B
LKARSKAASALKEQSLAKRRKSFTRLLLGMIATCLVSAAFVLRSMISHGGQEPAEPFRIAGNLYYVGAHDVTAFLLTGPKGHVLIDGGYPGTAPMIVESIAKLGFDIRDVKLLLNSHGHLDHAGGLAALKRASGAELWVSEGDAGAVESGGIKDVALGPLRFLTASGLLSYPPAKVDRRLKDGSVVRLGPIQLTAHITPGHTRGCTSWSFPVRHGARELLAVHVCSLGLPPLVSLVEPERYPGVRADFERSFRRLRSLPADIHLAPHARQFDAWRKVRARRTASDPVEPFIDPRGYRRAIDEAERKFQARLAEQQGE